MLTLTRKIGQEVIITTTDGVIIARIVLKQINRNNIRLGFIAPDEIKIYRDEVYEDILSIKRAS